jgi:hypothetical protein
MLKAVHDKANHPAHRPRDLEPLIRHTRRDMTSRHTERIERAKHA